MNCGVESLNCTEFDLELESKIKSLGGKIVGQHPRFRFLVEIEERRGITAYTRVD